MLGDNPFPAPPQTQQRQPFLNPNLLQALSGFAAGNTVGEQFANVNNILTGQQAKAQETDQKNKTVAFLQQKSPELANAVASGAMSATDAYASYLKQQQESAEAAKPKYQVVNGKIVRMDQNAGKFDVVADFGDPKKPNIVSTKNGLYNADTNQWIQPPEGALAENLIKRGLTPIWGTDKDGNTVLGTLGEDGSFKPVALPEGFKPTPGTSQMDLGTTIGVRDNKTGQVIKTYEKDLAGAERQKEIGANEGKQIAAAPADLQAGLNAKDLITQLKTDPNREWGTGLSGWLTNSIPSSPGYDYQTKVNQAKSGAFLTSIQQMRGMGSLSNAEGETATKAVTRMNTATSEEAFLEALSDYEKIIDQGIERARSRVPSTATDNGQQDPLGIRK